MTKDYKDFLDWATPQLTLNQYRKLARIIHSFKKYNLITGQATSTLCQFKDDQVYAYTNFPKFFAEMAELSEQNIENFFNEWYYDNVIFWPYKEAPGQVETRKRLMKKCGNHSTPYRFLYVFRENRHGEITCFNIVNKCYAGSPLHRWGLETYINALWFEPALENNHMAPRDYTIEHNTKAIIRAVSGVTNKEYKQYLFETTKPFYCTTHSHEQTEQHKAKHLFGDLKDITPYKFDETILYRLFGYIHRYKKTITLLGQPYHKAGHSTILEHMVYIIKHLSAEGKLKEVK